MGLKYNALWLIIEAISLKVRTWSSQRQTQDCKQRMLPRSAGHGHVELYTTEIFTNVSSSWANLKRLIWEEEELCSSILRSLRPVTWSSLYVSRIRIPLIIRNKATEFKNKPLLCLWMFVFDILPEQGLYVGGVLVHWSRSNSPSL